MPILSHDTHDAPMSTRRPRLMLLSMYPLDAGIWGATARITHMRDELRTMVELDVVSGLRLPRSVALARYVTSRRLSGLAGIYVETSTTLPGPVDVAFMALARSLRIPVLTYLRDAQPLFPEYYRGGSPKRWLSRTLFRPAFAALGAASDRVAYPSTGLAAAFGDHDDPLLIPPGAPEPVVVPRAANADRLLFVGGMRYPVHGLDILFGAIERVRAEGIPIRLTCVSRPGEEPPPPYPAWFSLARGSGPEIHRLLPDVLATVQPRHRSPYNDLGVPVKIMEYLSYGRPLLVTNCTETERIIRDAGAGVVVDDTAEDLARGIRELATAGTTVLNAYSDAATRAATEQSWHARAQHVVQILGAAR